MAGTAGTASERPAVNAVRSRGGRGPTKSPHVPRRATLPLYPATTGAVAADAHAVHPRTTPTHTAPPPPHPLTPPPAREHHRQTAASTRGRATSGEAPPASPPRPTCRPRRRRRPSDPPRPTRGSTAVQSRARDEVTTGRPTACPPRVRKGSARDVVTTVLEYPLHARRPTALARSPQAQRGRRGDAVGEGRRGVAAQRGRREPRVLRGQNENATWANAVGVANGANGRAHPSSPPSPRPPPPLPPTRRLGGHGKSKRPERKGW